MFDPFPNNRNWGFRFSLVDGLALLILAAVAVVLYRNGNLLWWLVLFVGGHFFLFCNIFRASRRRELTWAAFLVLNVSVWMALDRLDWLHVILCQIPMSVGVVISEITGSRYHGIFANRQNSEGANYLSRDIE